MKCVAALVSALLVAGADAQEADVTGRHRQPVSPSLPAHRFRPFVSENREHSPAITSEVKMTDAPFRFSSSTRTRSRQDRITGGFRGSGTGRELLRRRAAGRSGVASGGRVARGSSVPHIALDPELRRLNGFSPRRSDTR